MLGVFVALVVIASPGDPPVPVGPQPSSVASKLKEMFDEVTSYHWTPELGPDGRSHHFYKVPESTVQAVTPQKADNLAEYFKNFHVIPKTGSDGKYHFWFAEAGEEAPHEKKQFMTVYHSDISDVPLEYGKFYHKIGQNYDITDVEYSILSPAEQQRYVRIDSEDDLMRIVRDGHYDQQPALPAQQGTLQQPASAAVNQPKAKRYYSDVSHVPLEFGRFYHKPGFSFDITDVEFGQLTSAEKAKFVRIDSQADMDRYDQDEFGPRKVAAVVSMAEPVVPSNVHAVSPLRMVRSSSSETKSAPKKAEKLALQPVAQRKEGSDAHALPVYLFQQELVTTPPRVQQAHRPTLNEAMTATLRDLEQRGLRQAQ
jgi:hypothetical protein